MDNRKMIYLDDAIDALERKKDKKAKGDIGGFYNKIIQNDIDALMQLPSAQPEIIYCKNCKYYRWEIDMCDEPYSTARNVVHEDDYCSKAERRTDCNGRD